MCVYRLVRDRIAGGAEILGGAAHPDRNAQFEHINTMVKRLQQRGQPVISVNTKKKELVGQFKNGGREWQPRGEPERVDVHDFPDPHLGKSRTTGRSSASCGR